MATPAALEVIAQDGDGKIDVVEEAIWPARGRVGHGAAVGVALWHGLQRNDFVAKLSREELTEIEKASLPGPGSCSMMGTANTMACVTEAIGMSLPADELRQILGGNLARLLRVGEGAVLSTR